MAARTKSRVTPKYRVRNWAAYESSLRRRGDITVWFNDDAVAAWNAPVSGLPGGQRKYSELAITTALTLRTVYHLPLRQTEGFVALLIRLIGLALDTPDHATLSRRGQSAAVPLFATTPDGPIHLVIDSTGLKMEGDGEWHVAKHKTTNKRRTWRKLHLGVDGNGFIVAARLTESGSSDSMIGVQMVEVLDVSVQRFTADGAYDSRAMYEALAAVGVPGLRIVIPPPTTAVPDSRATGARHQRNEVLEAIALVGRHRWRKESGAHQQARGETAMFRYKSIIGDRLRARRVETQATEAAIAVNVLNRMTSLGKCESVPVVA